MVSPVDRDLKMIIHPVIFVLKEGQEFNDNLLNYSLMMLHVCSETIKSPIDFNSVNKNSLINEVDYLNITAPQTLKNK